MAPIRILPIIGFLYSSFALAYVPASFFVIDQIVSKHSHFENGRFEHKITLFGSSVDEVLHRYNETMVLKDDDVVSIRIVDETGKIVAIQTRKISRLPVIERPWLHELVFQKDYSQLFEHLKRLGLPVKTKKEVYSTQEVELDSDTKAVSPLSIEPNLFFLPLDSGFAQVISKDRDDLSTSLWVQKEDLKKKEDSFLPLRLLFSVDSDKFDLRFDRYQNHNGFRFPSLIMIYRNATIWAKLELSESKFGNASGIEVAIIKEEPDRNTQKFLEQYLKWIR